MDENTKIKKAWDGNFPINGWHRGRKYAADGCVKAKEWLNPRIIHLLSEIKSFVVENNVFGKSTVPYGRAEKWDAVGVKRTIAYLLRNGLKG